MLLLEDAVKADFRRNNHLHIENKNRECYKWYMIHLEQLHTLISLKFMIYDLHSKIYFAAHFQLVKCTIA